MSSIPQTTADGNSVSDFATKFSRFNTPYGVGSLSQLPLIFQFLCRNLLHDLEMVSGFGFYGEFCGGEG